MDIISHGRNLQQNLVQTYAQNQKTKNFFELLNSSELSSVIEQFQPAHRERVFPPTDTLALFLSQVQNTDSSCQNIVNQYAVQRMRSGLPVCSTHTGSYCKARQRLPLEMLSALVQQTAKLIDEQVPLQWRWKNRSVKLIDGTTVTMPDTPDNQENYPQQQGQKPGLGFPICRIVGVICLASGVILNAAMGPFKGKGACEQNMLRELLDTFQTGDIVLGDGFFGTYFLLAELVNRGVDGVFEQLGARKRATDFRKGKKLGPSDHLITYKKPKKPDWMTQEQYLEMPETLIIRELKVSGKILVTTILSPKEASRQELKSIYKNRWHVELDLRNIKTTLGMETFSCKTPQMVEKEMWIYFLAYNLIRLVMAQAASYADLEPRQLSFKHTLQLWRAWRNQLTFFHNDNESLEILLGLIVAKLVGNRPGRVEPRAVKRRPKPFSLLVKPRTMAREEIKKNGHPKKQK